MAPIWLDVLDETARLCVAHGRTDLLERLRQKRAQLLDPRLRVLVIGEPKQGKSQLVNALINAPVCPVGDGPTTALPTVVQHAETPSAVLVRSPLPVAGRPAADASRAEDRIPLPMEQVATGIGGKLRQRTADESVHVEVGVPRALLATGLVLIDTPGTDTQDPARVMNGTVGFARADVVVMVSDATRELSVTELNLLLHVLQSHPHIIVALSKIDIAPQWRAVAERNRHHLANAGIPAALIPVSATLRLRAARSNDRDINAESGFPELIARLSRDLSRKNEVLAGATAGLTARTVIEQLAAPLRAELSTRDDADDSGPMSRLREAQRAVDELRRLSARWQNSLNDEVTDLISDIEYDLRDRTRQILRKVDEAFDEADPVPAWETFQEWLESNLVEAAEANYEWLVQRCEWIAQRVADNFRGYGYDAAPDWSLTTPQDPGSHLSAIEQPPVDRFTPVQKVITGLKGSYGGLLMFGLATTLAGMPLINPISLGAGALFGGKSIHDESRSLLKRRQAVAKGAVQRHVDDFFIKLNKDCKDTVRNVQRTLRDHFTAVTEELQEAIVQSFRTAKQAADADAVERDQRQRQIEQQMKRLGALYEQAQELLTGRATASRVPLGPRV
ncbi:Dynamin family protein [Micromonospora pattaloongensis]|uniref:Dynamin family protein n=2 Tax=Micromonospora pattaloongensis TaxID=405436 RepID=A0A1H3SVM9_9ACTN|nr:Dynamin family protein [Micromonospora pattaloongensis]